MASANIAGVFVHSRRIYAFLYIIVVYHYGINIYITQLSTHGTTVKQASQAPHPRGTTQEARLYACKLTSPKIYTRYAFCVYFYAQVPIFC